jgi:Aldehyde dehydrogenase family
MRIVSRSKIGFGVQILAGGQTDDSRGYFVRPTVVQADDPAHEVFTTEYFGPILGVFVYDDGDYDTVVRQAADAAAYALTGAIIARDRGGDRRGQRAAAVLRRQLLHQRQAHRRGGRPPALRRRPGQQHQRQGRLRPEPAALGVTAQSRRPSFPPSTTATLTWADSPDW